MALLMPLTLHFGFPQEGVACRATRAINGAKRLCIWVLIAVDSSLSLSASLALRAPGFTVEDARQIGLRTQTNRSRLALATMRPSLAFVVWLVA